jgi:hypothetical protein
MSFAFDIWYSCVLIYYFISLSRKNWRKLNYVSSLYLITSAVMYN